MRSTMILAVVPMLGLVACASNPGAPVQVSEDEPQPVVERPVVPVSAELPDDFSVDITILAAGDGQPAETHTSRYVLFPDGTLHFAARPGYGPNTMPPVVRRLSHRDIDVLWNSARNLGLADPSTADDVSNFRKVWSPWEGHVYLLAFTADGRYWNFTRKVDPGDELDPAIRSFLRDMAALAWAEDRDGEALAFDPYRYDYGPDPYATYRANEAELKEQAGSDDER